MKKGIIISCIMVFAKSILLTASDLQIQYDLSSVIIGENLPMLQKGKCCGIILT